jgi:hypothetical protein
MLRFGLNRWWALVLTLCLFTAGSLLTAQIPSVASADTGSSYQPADDQPTRPMLGDPDVPMGPGDGKAGGKYVVGSRRTQVVPQAGARPVGDGAAPISVAMDRLRLFLLGLRSLYLGF